jgi:hypothetical protein
MTTPTLTEVTKANDDLATRLVAAVTNLVGRLHANNQAVTTIVEALEAAHAQTAPAAQTTATAAPSA